MQRAVQESTKCNGNVIVVISGDLLPIQKAKDICAVEDCLQQQHLVWAVKKASPREGGFRNRKMREHTQAMRAAKR